MARAWFSVRPEQRANRPRRRAHRSLVAAGAALSLSVLTLMGTSASATLAVHAGPTSGRGAGPVGPPASPAAPMPPPPPSQRRLPPGAVVVMARPSPFGPILETAAGFTLYTFSGDELDFALPTACTSKNTTVVQSKTVSCTTVWPPLLATGPLVAEGGAHQRLLGTVTRPSGEHQVTYNGHPLYGFVADTGPNEYHGENLASFFGIWHLVSAQGRPDAGRALVQTEVSRAGVVLSTPTAPTPSGTPTYRSVYELTTDPNGETTCTATTGCSSIWPPLLTDGPPRAGVGVNARLLGTLRRPDGALQVTYNGRPLYLFAFDLGPGAQPSGLTNGEYLIDFHAKGVWYLMSPTGLPDPGTPTLTSITVSEASTPVLGAVSGFGAGNFALYGFSLDTSSTSRCTGPCAIAWPPLLTSTPPSSDGLPGTVGVIQRPDGTFQVTYDGHPLYLFGPDPPDAAQGQGISAFGGTFDLIDAQNGAFLSGS